MELFVTRRPLKPDQWLEPSSRANWWSISASAWYVDFVEVHVCDLGIARVMSLKGIDFLNEIPHRRWILRAQCEGAIVYPNSREQQYF